MRPAFSARCREIFERVVDLERDRRLGVIQEACAGDTTLQRAVERLIAAFDAQSDFLELGPAWMGVERDDPQIGRYTVLRKLGEGGMGRVYLADPGPVAVKVIRKDLDPTLVARRFLRERDALSRLKHPNIARLIDGGTTRDGTPYLVMTYVDGAPLDEFCRSRELNLRELLELFRMVCRAVSFAHGRLVIHRDLKPSNILVTSGGVPIVLDFGLAKLARTSLEVALDSTRTGHRLLTPEYASPEQVRGTPVTPSTDVYALGLILYELVSGIRPHRFATWSMAEIVDVICHSKPVAPSAARSAETDSHRRTPPSIDPRELEGPIDFMVMKGIAKAPVNRYTHVAELDDDIRRFLEGEPIPGLARRTYQT
jgi:serine/threonine protein kinase